ncbi:MAG: hypothetical protein K0Q53_697 [Massilibacillus sp.]|jgi:hypothetical protein|nr:hypothetical protein [Massilibacillus sp.]
MKSILRNERFRLHNIEDELREFKRSCSIADEPSVNFVLKLFLWTERGAIRQIK